VLRKVANATPRTGADELAFGDLLDDLDAYLDGEESRVSTAPSLALAVEDWTPPKE
jgi:hypothetical protein